MVSDASAVPEGTGDGEAEASAPAKPAGPLCESCGLAPSKYRCPGCDRRTCSAACVAAHKVQHKCTGRRARAEFVAPLNSFTDSLLLRDFGLLEECDAAVDRANRQLQRDEDDLRLHQKDYHRKRILLARACAVSQRRTRLVLAPSAMSLARSNTTKVVLPPGCKGGFKGKGKGKKGKGKGKGKGGPTNDELAEACIHWRVEWHFGRSGRVFVDKCLKEKEILGEALTRMLENNACEGRAMKHLLLPYAQAGIEKLEVFLHQPSRAEVALATDTTEAGGTGPAHGESEPEPEEDEDKEIEPDREIDPAKEPAKKAEDAERDPQAAAGSKQEKEEEGPDHSATEDERELPAGWARAEEEGTGKPYYYRVGTTEVQWEFPLAEPEAKRRRLAEDSESEESESKSDSDEESAESAVTGEDVQGQDVDGDQAVASVPYVRLDKALSLHENLQDRAIVEFPVLHIALPDEIASFLGTEAA